MFDITRKEVQLGGRSLTLESGLIARQADGAVVATYGATSVLCTVVFEKKPKEGVDFFPLTVNYQEKAFAAGKIPGGFFKREGRPSEKETLTSRLIDRPIRPLFPDSFKHEVQIICTLLSHDLENDPDMVALIGASAALAISGAPFMGPIAGVRVGYDSGEYQLNPTPEQLVKGALDLVVAGTDEGVLMVESEAKELSEEIMLGAVKFGHEQFQPVIELINELKSACGRAAYVMPDADPRKEQVAKQVAKSLAKPLAAAYEITSKAERQEALKEMRSSVEAEVVSGYGDDEVKDIVAMVSKACKECEKDHVRGSILKTGIRIDKRDTVSVRQIDCRTGILQRSHGSALFTRGETQVIAAATLGTGQDEQMIDALAGEYRESFMLHYNFPPYSVGEAGRTGSPGRREIGHGKLAWRAIRPLLPSKEKFPYTIRVVSEVTESNGSSSMASVCGTSMALMDAGVSLKRPCAGIAMGLIKEGKEFAILSDILGDEDHLGDMDFKVAGSEKGITALQMDIKITSITADIMKDALAQALDGRLHILSIMNETISGGREQVSEHAPRITVIHVPKDKIRDIIGTGGKVIREIVETTGAKVDIEDDGTVMVSSVDESAAKAAIDWIEGLTAEAEVGKIYKGTVVRLTDFGAFVNFLGAKDGLVHISEIVDQRVESVNDVLTQGQEVYVKCLGMDNGKVRLSMRSADQTTGEELEVTERPFKRGGDRGFDGGGGGGRGGGGGGRGGDRDGGGRGGDRGGRGGDRGFDGGGRGERGGGGGRGGDRDRGDRGGDRGDRGERGDRGDRGDRGGDRDGGRKRRF